ncbi:hypothetical protein AVEN_262656-1 [Araneus ventricosus]|uniref:Uncharacterized protein n=1 Tax=Araneus ventricosus TaxID=182803 RepID=A0A4Y2SIG4_ARAVE|nr:hypothetical protein AVEN_202199-1 [Araneus ventricosus]GBN87384.1 hypothetical protein AVEN_212853-1 [Araneus ventricosus]GBN87681.1 hypothetical protein AVEN_79092-1 [Araneus ventricosus]GBN87730.1 hypothetical protein AVEN_262656-1 [Araneus ventricosus]
MANKRCVAPPGKLVLQSWWEVVITTSQQTCFASGLVDFALLHCRKFASKLPHQFYHDKLISRKIKLAESGHAIWELEESHEERNGFSQRKSDMGAISRK